MKDNTTKITLSAKELELVCNTGWILTKHIIIQKAIAIFSDALPRLQHLATENGTFLSTEMLRNPKISKGENYKGLPYVILDYPRYFEKEDTMAIRTLFWWGNFFSINLQLAGKMKKAAAPHLLARFLWLQQREYYICVGETPWQHHFAEDNYVSVQHVSLKEFEALLVEKPFIKIGKKIALQHWDAAPLFVESSFMEMMELLKINFPGDEKGL